MLRVNRVLHFLGKDYRFYFSGEQKLYFVCTQTHVVEYQQHYFITRNLQGLISRESHLYSFDCFVNSGIERVTS